MSFLALNAPIKSLIQDIEVLLVSYYGLRLDKNLTIFDFLISKDVMKDFLSVEQRGCLLLDQKDIENPFLGVYFCPSLFETLTCFDPREKLSHQNIDAFCVLVEEISHFLLVMDRGLKKRQTKKLELEWQAEIDKVLVSALFLKNQVGRFFVEPLLHALYERASCISLAEKELYQSATTYAARFWLHMIKLGFGTNKSLYCEEFVASMRRNYVRPLEEKYPFAGGISIR